MRANRPQEPRTDSRHAVEGLDAAERPMAFPVGDDGAGEREPDSWQAGDFDGRRMVQINAFSWDEGAGERQARVFMGAWGPRSTTRKQLDLSGRGTGLPGQEPEPLPRGSKTQDEENGSALGSHGAMIGVAGGGPWSGKMRVGAEKRRQARKGERR